MFLIEKKIFFNTKQDIPKLGESTAPKTKEDIKADSQKAQEDINKLKGELDGLKGSSLGKEKLERVEEILEKVKTLKSNERIVGERLTHLETGLQLITENPSKLETIDIIKEDSTEISEIRERILNLKRELNEIELESSALQRTLETFKQNKLTKKETEQFKTITNKEFLRLSPQERLRFVSVGNITYDQVKSGKKKNIEFTFTYDGVFNRDFYARTTAGQVLPPEVRELKSGSEVFIRNGISGEFFTASGKRLKIHEETKVDVAKLASTEELKKIQETDTQKAKEYIGKPNEDIVLEALRRGIDPKFALLTFGEQIEKLQGIERKVAIEDKLTDIARLQDDFSDDYPNTKSFEGGKVTESFAAYVTGIMKGDAKKIATAYGFNESKFSQFNKPNRYKNAGPLKMENVNMEGVSKEEIDKVLKMKRFTPGSKEAVILFTVAARAAGLPEKWGASSELQRILSKESNGVVARLNYTIPKSMSPESFKQGALERRNNNPFGVRSTASGLGQLLLSNVDKYYPDGRNGIGDALNEAVGMLRYIHDRYGSPEVAGSVYGRKASYVNARTQVAQVKGFAEGY